MIKQKRYERILEILGENNAVSIEDFCSRLNVSKATVRRDLIYLDEQKLLKRTHGGAVSMVKSAIEDVPISLRHRRFRDEKDRIAKAALQFIEEGMTIYLGTGSTVQALAAQLSDYAHLTIVTNDIGVAYDISQNTQNALFVAGGKLEPSTATVMGPFAEHMLRDMHVDFSFMSADAVTPRGFMDLNMDEVQIKRTMIENANKTVMLCDQSKFGTEAFMAICPLSGVFMTITNDELDPVLEKKLLDAEIRLRNA